MINQEVAVTVKTNYLRRESRPEKKRYVFSYTITVINHSAYTIQLLSRHWIITCGDTLKNHQVSGDGVMGQQPKIKPGAKYTYTSGTVIQSPVGTMHGCYKMIDENSNNFNAEIKPFILASPEKLN